MLKLWISKKDVSEAVDWNTWLCICVRRFFDEVDGRLFQMWVEINLRKQKRKAGRKKRERGEVDIIWDLKSKNVERKKGRNDERK